MSIYRIALKYKIVNTCRDYTHWIEYVKVQDCEEISDVIISLKERMFYEFDNSPIIEGVTYQKID